MSDTQESTLPMVIRADGLEVTQPKNYMSDPDSFAHLQRVAKMFAESSLIPEHLRGKVADVAVLLAFAQETGVNPLVLMQASYSISGKTGQAATYLIARANQSRKFTGSIRWRTSGAGEALEVTASATLRETGESVEASATMRRARDENWVKNPKYKTMPVQMLSYRAAVFLIRLYCPEAIYGFASADEIEDMAWAEGRVDARGPSISPTSREPAGQRYLASRPAPEADDDFEEVEAEDAPLPPPAAPPPQEPAQRKPAATAATPTPTPPIQRAAPVVRPAAPPTIQRPSSMVGSAPRDGGASETREEIQTLIDDLEGAASGVLSNFQVDMDAGGVAAISESRLKPLLAALKRLAVEEGAR